MRSPGFSLTPTTVEQWARCYIEACTLDEKCRPPAPPSVFQSPEAVRLASPGRPAELVARAKVSTGGRRRPNSPRQRAKLLHTFWHHELQAAELMCWAVLAFPDTELAFRVGLLSICQDEIRHMGLYQQRLETLGFALGDFPVRDWIWDRVPTCPDVLSFICLMGLGLESANLEHTARFEREFRDAGDLQSAAVQAQVGEEEIAHAAFAAHWFRKWRGDLDFELWRASLPPPLSPLMMRGTPLNRVARTAAAQPPAFLDALQRWQPDEPDS